MSLQRLLHRSLVDDIGDLLGTLRSREPGDGLAIGVVRDGEEVNLDVTLGERPA